jgi:hypothetical protein
LNFRFLNMKFISSEREDDLPSFMEPQASLPSAAQPAVMDIRRLLALASDKVERGVAYLRYESSVRLIKFMGLIGLITLSPFIFSLF